jgi:hypothetical protein
VALATLPWAPPDVHLQREQFFEVPLSLKELDTRWDYADQADFHGIAETCSIDQSKHSIFGASKVASHVMVQEHRRYFCLEAPGQIRKNGGLRRSTIGASPQIRLPKLRLTLKTKHRHM